MPTWQRASLAYRVQVRLIRGCFVAWPVALGWVAVTEACGLPPALIEFVALTLAGSGWLAFAVAIAVLSFLVPRHPPGTRNRNAAALMMYRDVFAGIPAFQPPRRELPTMRWK